MAGMNYPVNLGLGDAPDPELDPGVWQELNKLQLAAKHIATALNDIGGGATNAAKLVGTPGAKTTIQDYTRLKIIPGVTVPAGSILEIEGTDVHLTSASHPYPVAYAEDAIAAGTQGIVILLGMVYYAPGGLVPGAKYYVNTAIDGGITTTPYGRFIGQAFATSVLFFDPTRV